MSARSHDVGVASGEELGFVKRGVMLFMCAILGACGQGGCVIFSHPIALDGGHCNIDELRFDSLLEVGVVAHVEFGLDEKCYADIQELFPLALTVDVDVVDPSGRSVGHVASLPLRRQVGSSHYEDVVKVTFTPDKPGTWRLRADFGPGFGRSDQDIEVIDWRGDAPMRVIPWDVPPDCVGYELTEKGTGLCVVQTRPSPPILWTSRGQSFEGASFAVSENALWRLTSAGTTSRIELLEDDGSAFNVTHSVLSPYAIAGTLVANSNGAWLLSSTPGSATTLTLVHLTPVPDAGISVVGVGVAGNQSVALMIANEAALFVTSPSSMGLVSSDGGVLSLEYNGRLGAADPQALWFTVDSDPLAAPGYLGPAADVRALWPGGDSVRMAQLPMARQSRLSPTRPYFGVPLVPLSMSSVSDLPATTGSFAVPRLSGVRMSLESFDAGMGFAPVSAATDRHAFARSLDGRSLKVFER